MGANSRETRLLLVLGHGRLTGPPARVALGLQQNRARRGCPSLLQAQCDPRR
jgi:hypothetical protein